MISDFKELYQMAVNNRLAMNEFKQVYQMSLYNRNSKVSSVQNDPAALSLEDMFGKVLVSGFMSLTDRKRLQSILLDESIGEEHHAIINRLLYGVRRGFIKVAF